jgi:hypothetical protein
VTTSTQGDFAELGKLMFESLVRRARERRDPASIERAYAQTLELITNCIHCGRGPNPNCSACKPGSPLHTLALDLEAAATQMQLPIALAPRAAAAGAP